MLGRQPQWRERADFCLISEPGCLLSAKYLNRKLPGNPASVWHNMRTEQKAMETKRVQGLHSKPFLWLNSCGRRAKPNKEQSSETTDCDGVISQVRTFPSSPLPQSWLLKHKELCTGKHTRNESHSNIWTFTSLSCTERRTSGLGNADFCTKTEKMTPKSVRNGVTHSHFPKFTHSMTKHPNEHCNNVHHPLNQAARLHCQHTHFCSSCPPHFHCRSQRNIGNEARWDEKSP